MSEKFCSALRWSARISALLVVGMFLFLTVGSMLYTAAGFPARLIEWITFAVFFLGLGGLLLAWKWEAPGALLSLGCFAVFAAMVPLADFVPVAIAALPAVLFLADFLIRRLSHVSIAAS